MDKKTIKKISWQFYPAVTGEDVLDGAKQIGIKPEDITEDMLKYIKEYFEKYVRIPHFIEYAKDHVSDAIGWYQGKKCEEG